MIRFGIIGAGWRTEFFLRIAAALPDRFEVTGVVTRSPERAARMRTLFKANVVDSLDGLVATKPCFMVTSVSYAANEGVLIEAATRGIPILAETPPAGTIEGLPRVWHALKGTGGRVQVAEQYHLQPLHAARIAFVQSGQIGTPSVAHISVAHGYHGISLIRRYLGLTFERATITARRWKSALVEGAGRNGPPEREVIKESQQDIASLDFGDKHAIFDFSGDQYFSWVRSNRVLVRGERGEVVDERATYLKDFKTPVQVFFTRVDTGHTGNLEGLYHKGIVAGESWLYRNPLAPASLSDDEIAIGDCLLRMQHYVETGQAFYSLAEASQDTYLGLLIGRAIETGQAVHTEVQAWAEA